MDGWLLSARLCACPEISPVTILCRLDKSPSDETANRGPLCIYTCKKITSLKIVWSVSQFGGLGKLQNNPASTKKTYQAQQVCWRLQNRAMLKWLIVSIINMNVLAVIIMHFRKPWPLPRHRWRTGLRCWTSTWTRGCWTESVPWQPLSTSSPLSQKWPRSVHVYCRIPYPHHPYTPNLYLPPHPRYGLLLQDARVLEFSWLRG